MNLRRIVVERYSWGKLARSWRGRLWCTRGGGFLVASHKTTGNVHSNDSDATRDSTSFFFSRLEEFMLLFICVVLNM